MMNILEAKVIMACQKAKTPSKLFAMFNYYSKKYSYNYIANTCKRLSIIKLLIRRKLGKNVYYISTKDAIIQAVSYLNLLTDEQQEMKPIGVVVKDLRAYTG